MGLESCGLGSFGLDALGCEGFRFGALASQRVLFQLQPFGDESGIEGDRVVGQVVVDANREVVQERQGLPRMGPALG